MHFNCATQGSKISHFVNVFLLQHRNGPEKNLGKENMELVRLISPNPNILNSYLGVKY